VSQLASDLPPDVPLASLLDSVPVLVSFVDSDLRYRFVNQQYSEWFGMTREEIVGRTMDEVLGEHAVAALRPHITRALAGETTTFEARVPYHRGGTRCIDASYVPHRSASGDVTGFIIMVRDITSRVQMEEALRESEQRFHAIAETAPVLIWVNEENRATFLNRQYEEFTGRPMSWLSTNWPLLVHPDDADAYLGAYERAYESRRPFEAQFRFRRADGEYRWLKSIGVPRFSGREFVGYIGCSVDVTDVKKAERVLREHQRRS
jgi:PAS domain S-box-containing protein